MSKVNLLTQAEYAKRRGCSAVAVHKAVKAGRISLIGDKIDPAVADIQWSRNTRARAANRAPGAVQTSERPATVDEADGGSAGTGDYWDARSRREAAEAAIAEMKEAEMRAALIRVDAVRSAWAAKITAVREALLQIPQRLAPVLAAESDLERVAELLEAELRQALQQLVEERGVVAEMAQ